VNGALQPQRHDHSEKQRANQSAAAVSCGTPGMGSSESSGGFKAKTMGPRNFDARNPPEKVPPMFSGSHNCGKFRANRAE
jgi:hypothetical protein